MGRRADVWRGTAIGPVGRVHHLARLAGDEDRQLREWYKTGSEG